MIIMIIWESIPGLCAGGPVGTVEPLLRLQPLSDVPASWACAHLSPLSRRVTPQWRINVTVT